MMDRYLAIDYGTKRVGLAITDPLKIIAQPFETLVNDNALIKNIEKIVKEKNVSRIIIGDPIKLDGSIGQAATAVAAFVELMRVRLPTITFIMQDERMTTAEAQKRMIESDASRKTRKGNIDKTAASLILQQYLLINHK